MIERNGSDATLHLTRTFAAPRERVFRAWTEPAALATWWWPWNPMIAIDLRPGGAYRFTAEHPGAGELAVSGEFLEVDPPARLVYTFAWDGDERVTRVAVEFRDLGEATEVILRHTGFATAEERDNHGLGWNDCLDRLRDLVTVSVVG